MKCPSSLVLVAALASSVAVAEDAGPSCRLYYWLWWHNVGTHWREVIDFAADQNMDGVVIWGLQGWKGDGKRARKVVRYAHARNIKVIHGLGLNGYEVGKYIVQTHPELAAIVPPALADTKKGKWTRNAVFCPSKPKSLELLKEALLKAADTGIDGFNFETADKDAEYRSLDYSVQYWTDGAWHDVNGMPIMNNPVHGWVEHRFPPVTTTRLRIHITRSKYGNRMGLGEWEVYAP